MLSILLFVFGLVQYDAHRTPFGAGGPQSARSVDGPGIVVHRQPGVPIVALRLSLLAYDPPGFAGAGHMVQHVQYPALRERARRVGGRIEIQRTSDAVVYTAIGPASELTYLADLLKSVLQLSAPPLDVVLRAERELREERLAEWETAPAHVRSNLRARLFPSDLSSAGTDRSATRFTPSRLPELWGRMYRPERVSVVAVGDIYLGDVQRAFADLPSAADPPALPIERDSIVLAPLAPAEATRAWIGSAYPASDLPPAAVTIGGRLIGDHIRERIPPAQVDVEHWWTHHGQGLVIVVAAPEPEMDTARRAVGTAVAAVLDDLTDSLIADAAAALRREMLFYARTPDRMADVVGRFIDRDGDPNAAERFYSELESVDRDQVRTVLDRLLDRSPARVEIPPQVLERR